MTHEHQYKSPCSSRAFTLYSYEYYTHYCRDTQVLPTSIATLAIAAAACTECGLGLSLWLCSSDVAPMPCHASCLLSPPRLPLTGSL